MTEGAKAPETTEAARSAVDKANVYGLLAAVFRRELSAAFLDELRRPALVAALAEAGVALDRDFLAGPADKVLEEHAVAYTALFIGPGKHVPPYASVHLAEGGGALWGPPTVWAKKFIEETGFEYSEDFHDLPDHVSVELEVMGHLWAREAEALADGDAETAAWCRARRATFLADHLARWVPAFCKMVAKESPRAFYREMAALLDAVIASEDNLSRDHI